MHSRLSLNVSNIIDLYLILLGDKSLGYDENEKNFHTEVWKIYYNYFNIFASFSYVNKKKKRNSNSMRSITPFKDSILFLFHQINYNDCPKF